MMNDPARPHPVPNSLKCLNRLKINQNLVERSAEKQVKLYMPRIWG